MIKRTTAAMAAVTAMLPASASGHDSGCSSSSCDARVREKDAHRRKLRIVRAHKAWLLATAACESGRRWHIATGNGFYGGLQFTLPSWRSVGGHGLPSEASALEQMYRGVLLRQAQGVGAWPHCGALA